MFLSLREFMWGRFFEGVFPPEKLTSLEILVALLISAVLAVVMYLIIRIPFFRIVRRAKAARNSAILIGGLLAFTWLASALELLGLNSTLIMSLFFSLSLIGTLIYLILKR